MPTGRTITGRPFMYSGSLAAGLNIQFGKDASTMNIPARIIDIIRTEITKRSPVLAGATRDPLVPNSLGKVLYEKHQFSPQALSYVLPLLIQEGFCTVSDRKPFVIHKK
jgi:hypothetical protein